MRRDPKSLYAGEGKGTVKGLSSFPFDPVDPDRVFLHLKSDRVSEQDCIRMAVERILSSMGLPGNSPGME
jgi:adenylylsulfate kinase-like enzyme